MRCMCGTAHDVCGLLLSDKQQVCVYARSVLVCVCVHVNTNTSLLVGHRLATKGYKGKLLAIGWEWMMIRYTECRLMLKGVMGLQNS